MKALEDQDKGQTINTFDFVKVKTASEDDKFKEDKRAFDDQSEGEGTHSFLFSLNTSYSNSSDSVLTFPTSQTFTLDFILQCFLVLLKLLNFNLVRNSFNFFNITTLDLILQGFLGLL